MNGTNWTRTAVAVAMASVLAAGCASWNSMGRQEKGTAIGAGTGAVAGAAVGGPVGAAVGAGVGGVVGHEAETPGARNGTTGTGTASTAGPVHDDIRSAQAQLQSRGFYNGPVDGVWGPATEQAVRDFQRANGITETGRLDGQTMTRLGASRTGVAR